MPIKVPKIVKTIWGSALQARVEGLFAELGEDLSQRNLIVHQSNDPTCEGYVKYLEEGALPSGVLYKWRRGHTQPAPSTLCIYIPKSLAKAAIKLVKRGPIKWPPRCDTDHRVGEK